MIFIISNPGGINVSVVASNKQCSPILIPDTPSTVSLKKVTALTQT